MNEPSDSKIISREKLRSYHIEVGPPGEFRIHCDDCRQRAYGFPVINTDCPMIYDNIWIETGMPTNGILCVACIERRLGRKLTPSDIWIPIPRSPGSSERSENSEQAKRLKNEGR